jgi:catechol 2,3-dioxygenase-like lactoylglutathione lyase family enzyme
VTVKRAEEIPMIRRIDHISIAVKDLEKAKAFFLDVLGGRELYCASSREQNFRFTTLELGTSCLIELIDPLGEEGFVHRFLERRRVLCIGFWRGEGRVRTMSPFRWMI